MAKKLQRIAIAYDFDGTLAPGNMQQHSFIPKLGVDSGTFWKEVKNIAKSNDMSEILAYMHHMLKKANEKGIPITKKAFVDHGKGMPLFPGVVDYFKKINEYARKKGLIIEHYVISSGLREILKGTAISKEFEMMYASAYMYNASDVAEWPALAIDYTTKTQFIFRINKGIKNAWDNESVNKYMPNDARPMPFNRMIYLGDGETDIPAMKTVSLNGGKAIAVYNPNTKTKSGRKSKKITQDLVSQGRANYVAPADYTEGSSLYKIIQLCIDSISAEVELESYKK
ncbi:MAG: haloacid dehalogenase-like hydrolase [Bacteroidetes bacterium]|nr:haloacid dehalogenase-like hydrolase [Bacteroidota bacterium]